MKNIAAVTESQTSQQLKHKGLKKEERNTKQPRKLCFQKTDAGAMSKLKTSLAFTINNLKSLPYP